MTNKEKAEKKIQIAIDKIIDLSDYVPNSICYKSQRILDRMRELESDISNTNDKEFKKNS